MKLQSNTVALFITLLQTSISLAAPTTNTKHDPIVVPLKNYFNGTDLQWYGEIAFGTPPQPLKLAIDTGSGPPTVPIKQCGAACSKQKTFDVNASSTYSDGDTEFTEDFATGIGVVPVGNDPATLWTWANARDRVCIGDVCVKQSMLLIVNQTDAFKSDPFDGIFGILNDSPWLEGLKNQTSLPQIAGLFTPPKGYNNGDGELILGGINEDLIKGNITYLDLLPATSSGNSSQRTTFAEDWAVQNVTIFVNGESSLEMTVVNINPDAGAVVFDSGTPNLLLPQNVTRAIYAKISPDIKPYDPLPTSYGIPCASLSNLTSLGLSLQFNSTTGRPFNLTIPSRELNVGPFPNQDDNDDKICQTFITDAEQIGRGDHPGFFSLIGQSALKYVYSVWDVDGRRVGFADNGVPHDLPPIGY